MNQQSAPKVNIRSVRSIFTTLVIILLAFTLGYLVRDKNLAGDVFGNSSRITIERTQPEEYQNVDFDLFWHVWNTLETSHLEKKQINDVDRVYGAIKGMVAAVDDPYTVFLTPEENRVTQEDLSGEFGGVGIQIGYRGAQLAVIAPLPNSPAEKAGVRAGDLIAGIKDVNKDVERGTQGITLPEAVQLIRGDIGTTVTLSLLREDNDTPIIVDLERATIDVPSVVSSFEGDNENVAYIQILKFGADTKREWDNAVLEVLKKENLAGVIIDVRNNPGGYLQGAIDLGGEFLNLSDTVVIEEDSDGNQKFYKTETQGRLTGDEVVVLVNQGSASASEILAGALRDNIQAPIIGENTFGKGTIQEPRQLENGLGLHITVAKWLTPNEFWVNEVGLEPDIVLEDNPETEVDEQLQAAIDYFSGESNTAGLN